jgi:hypothetical protein
MSTQILGALKHWIDTESGASFTASVGDRVYHLEAPEGTTLPLAVYGLVDASHVFGMDGTTSETYTLEVTVYGRTVDGGAHAALTIAQKAVNRLDKAVLSPTGYDRLTIRVSRQPVATIDGEAVAVTTAFRLEGTRL